MAVDRKTVTMLVRMTEQERRVVEAEAARRGVSMSALLVGSATRAAASAGKSERGSDDSEAVRDAVACLRASGFSSKEARRLVERAREDEPGASAEMLAAAAFSRSVAV
ncbi:MAG: hypothetical protein PHU85_00645 [Phycisphaerae bacterium]|nr:hypothetical protein [Phycisphaerae bacterium]